MSRAASRNPSLPKPELVRCAVLGLLVAVFVCSEDSSPFTRLTEEFTYESLALSPVAATAAGYHRHNGTSLDEQLDDYRPSEITRQRDFYARWQARFQQVDRAKLTPEDQADLAILQDQVRLSLLEFDVIQNYRHNPTVYVELIGNAVFNPYLLDYAPKEARYRQIVARLGKIPTFVEQAERQLVSAPEIWAKVAQQENDGNIELIDKTLRAEAPAASTDAYNRAAEPALASLRQFNSFLKKGLPSYPWQLGKEKYEQKFRFALGTDQTSAQVLSAAEQALGQIQEQMKGLAQQIVGKPDIQAALNKVAQDHTTPAAYFQTAKADLAEARQFVKDKKLVGLPARSNLQVIETPEFMRGIYSVGGFNQAPALEPQLGAYYWLTPIPASWDQARVESKLREYNRYGLKILTIHEAMPGHYVQFEYANDVEPKTRRILRALYGSGSYVEGWAVYVTEAMLDAGYLNHNPELRLTFLKQQLRVIANTILDIRFHTMGMTDQQAMDLMLNKGYQEREEAVGKLQRAKLSSCQLPTYYVGYRDWIRLRDRYRQMKSKEFQLSEFHEKALREGAVPLPVLARLLTKRSL